MKNVVDKLFSGIVRFPTQVIIVFCCILAACSFCLPKIKVDNSIDAFFNKRSKNFLNFELWKEQFGSDQLVIIAFKDKDIFTYENLLLINSLSKKLEALEYVDEVRSLATVNDIIGFKDDFIVEPLFEEIPTDPAELTRLRESVLSNPLYVKNIISEDATTAAIIVELEYRPNDSDEYKKEVIDNIKHILASDFNGPGEFYISGLAAIEHAYAVYMKNDLNVFIPLIFGVIFCILYISFRRLTTVLLPFIAILATLITTMAFFYLCGFSINNITTAIPPILIAIAIADSIHLVSESLQRKRLFTDASGDDSYLLETMKHLFIPCLLTTLTTSVGFLSITVSTVPPVKELGIAVGVGVFFALIMTFTLLPALAKKFSMLQVYVPHSKIDARHHAKAYLKEVIDRALSSIGRFTVKRKRNILVFAFFVIVGSIIGALRIEVDTSFLEYFKKSDPVYKAAMFLEDNITGVHNLNISLKAEQKDYFKDPKHLREIESLVTFLNTISYVDKTISVIDYIKEIHKSFHNEDNAYYAIPDSANLIAQYLLLYGARDLDEVVDSIWSYTTVRLRLKEHRISRMEKVINTIEEYLDAHFKGHVQAHVVGQTVLEVETNRAVTKGQLLSLTLAMLVIFGMMFFVFRSISVGFVSIVPNILPILINFGIMGWLGIRLDSATSMISAIAIGIIVDDTIHFLHCYQEALKNGVDYEGAVLKTLTVKGRPIVLTSVVLFCGFGILVFSHFMPTYYFGVLSALLMINALFADLFVLPAVLLIVKPKFRT